MVGKPIPVVVGDPPILILLPGHSESSIPALALIVSMFIVEVNTLLHLNGVVIVSVYTVLVSGLTRILLVVAPPGLHAYVEPPTDVIFTEAPRQTVVSIGEIRAFLSNVSTVTITLYVSMPHEPEVYAVYTVFSSGAILIES